MSWPLKRIGHGVGLRRAHFRHLLEHPVRGVDWFEVISENFFEPGGRPWAVLDKVRKEVPIVLHGTAMALGNVDPVPDEYLQKLKALIDRTEPLWVSDHLCWGGHGGKYAHDLLPLPYTEESLSWVVEQIDRVQNRLGRKILIENVSSYVRFRASTIPEWEFLSEVARRADCGILLDVNNVYVSSKNHGFSARSYLEAIPIDRVGQFHLAGHTDKGTFLLDTHIGPTPEDVWALYREAVVRFGRVPALVEWDEEVPEFEVLVAEAERARRIEAEALPSSDKTSELAKLQTRFYRLITAPNDIGQALPEISAIDPEAAPVSSWIAADSEKTAEERLSVYANMYFFRLLEVLKSDYPKVLEIVGAERFHNLATDYVHAHPPDAAALRHFGKNMPEFLRSHALSKSWPYLSDLARLEWTWTSVFDERDCEVLGEAELKALAPEDFPNLRLHLIYALRIFDLEYAVHDSANPKASPTTMLMWRKQFRVFFRPLSLEEAKVLRAIERGCSFAEACGALAELENDVQSGAQRAFEILQRGIEDGIFRSL